MPTLTNNDIELIKQRILSQRDISRLASTTSLLVLIEPDKTFIMILNDLRIIEHSLTVINKGHNDIRLEMSKDRTSLLENPIVLQNKIIKKLVPEHSIIKDSDFDNTFYILEGNLIEILE